MLAKKQFPQLIGEVSQALTPMVATARKIKQKTPQARVVFIGPCAAKKLEASRASVRSDVDFVITFEELAGMFAAKEIDFSKYAEGCAMHEATGAGRGYAVAGGVASAIEQCVKAYYPGVDVKIEHAEGLDACKKVLILAKFHEENPAQRIVRNRFAVTDGKFKNRKKKNDPFCVSSAERVDFLYGKD